MFYHLIIISGCDRFSLGNRDYLEIRPTAKVQMILGTNGSGKSSLAQLGFTPLPIDKENMKDGGYFIKELTHLGDKYRLEGSYEKGKAHFNFIKNEEVLLKQGTLTHYLQLVEGHLNYTRWLDDILQGHVGFVNLGPQQRQDLMAKISKSDFSKAFTALGKCKKQHSHWSAVSKFLQKRINEESLRLIDSEVKVELENKSRLLHEELAELQSLQLPTKPATVDLNTLYTSLRERLDDYLNQPTPDFKQTSVYALQDDVRLLVDKVNQVKGQLSLVSREVDEIQQELGPLELDEVDHDECKRQLAQLEAELDALSKLKQEVPAEYLTDHPGEVIQSLQYVLSDLPEEVPDPKKQYELERANLERSLKVERFEAALKSIEEELQMYQGIDTVTCPSCSHQFKPGVNPDTLKALNERRDKGMALIREAISNKEAAQLAVVEYLDKKAAYDQLHEVKRLFLPKYPGLFKYLDSLGGFSLGRELLSHLAVYESGCEIAHRSRMISERLSRVKVTLQERDGLDSKRKELTTQLDARSETLNALKESERALKAQLDLLNETIECERVDSAKYKALFDTLAQFDMELDLERERLLSQVRDERVKEIVITLGQCEKTLTEQSMVQSMIDDFTTQLKDAQLKEKVADLLVKQLSPKTGFIAEQIGISVGRLLTGLNKLFEKVWAYPLEVRMGQVGDSGLDYKFPMEVGDIKRSDISKGSTSIKEIIDRAMILMTYYSMDLMDYPLFLDEPDTGFDAIHGENLIPLIRDLSDSVRFSQLVVISHSESIQRAFPNSETLILDERNISYPHAYNEHVRFEPSEEVILR